MGEIHEGGGKQQVFGRQHNAGLHVVQQRAAELLLCRFLQVPQDWLQRLLLCWFEVIPKIALDG